MEEDVSVVNITIFIDSKQAEAFEHFADAVEGYAQEIPGYLNSRRWSDSAESEDLEWLDDMRRQEQAQCSG